MAREPPKSKIGKYIKQQLSVRRKRDGWTQNELARRAKLSPSGLSLIINGQVEPKAETLKNIANALMIEPKEILKIAGLIKEDHAYDPILLNSLKVIDNLPPSKRKLAIRLVKEIADTLSEATD